MRTLEYLVIGANAWCVDPDFQKAYRRWRGNVPSFLLEDYAKPVVTIYQIDTTHIEFAAGTAPVWVDYLGYINWTWKEQSVKDRDLGRFNNVVVAKDIYSGLLSKAPRSNKALDKFLLTVNYQSEYQKLANIVGVD